MEDARKVRDLIRANPARAAEIIFGIKLWRRQRQIINAVFTHGRVAAKTCHKVGKSMGAGLLVYLWALANPGRTKIVTTAPTGRQVQEIIWAEIRVLWHRAVVRGYYLGPEPNMVRWEISPGWVAIGVAADKYNPNAFQGMNSPAPLVILDEAAGIQPLIWTGAKAIAGNGAILAIGNPTDPSGEFARIFKSDPSWLPITISAYDTPNFTRLGITRDDIEQGTWRQKVPKEGLPFPHFMTPQLAEDYWVAGGRSATGPDYMARVLGEFPVSSDDTLIPLHWLDRAKERWHTKTEDDFVGPSIVGADVARFGGDESATGWRCGRVLQIIDAGKGRDTQANTDAIERSSLACDPQPTEVRVDSVGLGAGVYDTLSKRGLPFAVVSFEAGAAALDPKQFGNLRAEAWWAMRDGFECDEWIIDPGDLELSAQLANVKYRLDEKLKRWIEKKDDAKKRGLKSPDRGDALMMSVATVAPPFFWR